MDAGSIVSESFQHHGLPDSSVHGIFEARILEWVAIPGDLTDAVIEPVSLASSALANGFFTTCVTWCMIKDNGKRSHPISTL